VPCALVSLYSTIAKADITSRRPKLRREVNCSGLCKNKMPSLATVSLDHPRVSLKGCAPSYHIFKKPAQSGLTYARSFRQVIPPMRERFCEVGLSKSSREEWSLSFRLPVLTREMVSGMMMKWDAAPTETNYRLTSDPSERHERVDRRRLTSDLPFIGEGPREGKRGEGGERLLW